MTSKAASKKEIDWDDQFGPYFHTSNAPEMLPVTDGEGLEYNYVLTRECPDFYYIVAVCPTEEIAKHIRAALNADIALENEPPSLRP